MSVSLLLTNLTVTGSNIIYNGNLTGIGGAQVFVSGSNIFISGGAGGGGGGTVTQLQLDSLSGFTTGFSGYLYNRDNLISGILSSGLTNTGAALYSLTTGFSGYVISLISAASAGVSSINGSSGVLTLVGAGNVSVMTVGQTITVSGNTGDYALFAQKTALTATGQTLYGNDIAISGSLANTGQALYNLINNSSGLFVPTGTILSYLTGVPTGLDTSFFWFQTYVFSSIPRVFATIELSGANTLYGVAISGRATSGFWATFTDIVLETGIYLDVLAKS